MLKEELIIKLEEVEKYLEAMQHVAESRNGAYDLGCEVAYSNAAEKIKELLVLAKEVA